MALKDMQYRVNGCVGNYNRTHCPRLVGWKNRFLIQLLPEFGRLHQEKSIKVRIRYMRTKPN